MLKERISRNENRRHSSSLLPLREASFILPPKAVSLPRVSAASIRAYFQTLTEYERIESPVTTESSTCTLTRGDSFRKMLRNLGSKVQN
jgi:hypothetical protein